MLMLMLRLPMTGSTRSSISGSHTRAVTPAAIHAVGSDNPSRNAEEERARLAQLLFV